MSQHFSLAPLFSCFLLLAYSPACVLELGVPSITQTAQPWPDPGAGLVKPWGLLPTASSEQRWSITSVRWLCKVHK